MLATNSDREKLTITIKKSNKELLQYLADTQNRNISRQIDFLIEFYRDQSEQQIIDMLQEVDAKIAMGEKWLTHDELKSKLGI